MMRSRLEGQSRAYGVDIVVGASTRAAAGEVAAIELDLIVVKGKNEPERIHALLGDAGLACEPAFLAFGEDHARMLATYRGQRWDEAEALAIGGHEHVSEDRHGRTRTDRTTNNR